MGLRYEAFREARMRFRVPAVDWPDLCDAIQIMEAEARRVMLKEAGKVG